ncbi:MAG TPA: phosphoribosylformylglycinamidine synthase I [Candidatus Saccharimonadaceae bacterium]|jgi:phosphoribosylformylglycinamidine synthase|nr:phosphoribosylformylglycinamidine synthase I [Candidatus Saccharimonadaceae bacterium]
MNPSRVAILQFPGVNCERETGEALARVGLEPEIVRWTEAPERLAAFAAYVLPGGWSYQDRVRAGALAAKHPLVAALAAAAADGKPVLGICNGAQVLVEAGLVPGDGAVELALARNHMNGRTGYYVRWVTLRSEASPCVFTRHLEPGTLLPLPIAHGEGRFVARAAGRMAALVRAGQVPLRYATAAGDPAPRYPDNPNGAQSAAAAVCNARGNVLALMPHPERAQHVGALPPGVGGVWGAARDRALLDATGAAADAPGPGVALFEGLARHLAEVSV